MPNPFLVKEAVASVALEHPSSCTCRVCRAAHGDHAAWIELYTLLCLEEMER